MGRFIRRVVRANSGVLIEVMEKDTIRRNRVVAHIGTAHNGIEMRELFARAKEVVLDGQIIMDLGMEAGVILVLLTLSLSGFARLERL
ncbi:hypothetical protein [Mobiluncus mulieris]|uniref:hypothetical protein n=1 Tax=Mobiluncus mulieris TaxID=2052 RepID=UPI0024308389|nr:hypothetical protein [Mobiluncus mulieris]